MSGGFESFALSDEVLAGIEAMGYVLPTEVQDEAIPLILGGGDVMCAAPTGSGKTAAFALPIIELVAERKRQALAKPEEDDAEDDSQSGPCRLSGSDRSVSVGIDASGLECQCRSEGWGGARATRSVPYDARAYFEVEVLDEGLARVGVSTRNANLDLGTDANGWGYGGTAKKSHARKFETYGQEYGKGDVIGVAVDAGSVRFAKNGTWFDAIDVETREPLFPTVALKNAHVRLRFERDAWTFQAPSASPNNFGPVFTEIDKEEEPQKEVSKQLKKRGSSVSAVVVEPARELAEQTFACFEAYAQFVVDPAIRTRLLIGGCDCRAAERDCERGEVDIVVGTPLKLLDRVKRKKLDVSNAKFFVLDEADRYCEAGKDDLDTVLDLFGRLPTSKRSGASRLQVAFFSATLHSKEVRAFADLVCDEPTWVDLKGPSHLPETVSHLVIEVDPKNEHLVNLVASQDVTKGGTFTPTTDAVHRQGHVNGSSTLRSLGNDEKERASEFVKRVKPHLLLLLIDALDDVADQILVFCRTNLDCDLLEQYLKRQQSHSSANAKGGKAMGSASRYSCCVLAGGRDMRERRASLDAFKAGEVRIMVCTDVAARGIDVAGLPLVVNLTLPDSVDTYVHRCGRVGRAEKTGLAVSFAATVQEYVWYCQKGKKPPQVDTRPYAEGGNCVWYDEPSLLSAIETRFAKSSETDGASKTTRIHKLTPSSSTALALPPELQAVALGAGLDANAQNHPSKRHVQQITKDVDQLKQLETLAQRSFFDFFASTTTASSKKPRSTASSSTSAQPPNNPANVQRRSR